MKKLLIAILFVAVSVTVSAQEKTKSHSKWKETKDGVTYEMEASMTGVSTKNVEKPHITLNFAGDTKSLTKVAFKGDELYVTIPVVKGGQNINVAPGFYKLKITHDKLGEQEFDIELKKNDYKEIVLTLK
ncbi:MAG: hypothetical protein EOO87_12250 [Pedobacter sp.]|nr:MAG: hypothetical protein EOO87_12250 [Pedobacter sp.]